MWQTVGKTAARHRTHTRGCYRGAMLARKVVTGPVVEDLEFELRPVPHASFERRSYWSRCASPRLQPGHCACNQARGRRHAVEHRRLPPALPRPEAVPGPTCALRFQWPFFRRLPGDRSDRKPPPDLYGAFVARQIHIAAQGRPPAHRTCLDLEQPDATTRRAAQRNAQQRAARQTSGPSGAEQRWYASSRRANLLADAKAHPHHLQLKASSVMTPPDLKRKSYEHIYRLVPAFRSKKILV